MAQRFSLSLTAAGFPDGLWRRNEEMTHNSPQWIMYVSCHFSPMLCWSFVCLDLHLLSALLLFCSVWHQPPENYISRAPLSNWLLVRFGQWEEPTGNRADVTASLRGSSFHWEMFPSPRFHPTREPGSWVLMTPALPFVPLALKVITYF